MAYSTSITISIYRQSSNNVPFIEKKKKKKEGNNVRVPIWKDWLIEKNHP